MQSLTTALENLLRHLSQEIPATPAFGLSIFLSLSKDAFDALSWLASQQVYRNSTGNNVMVMKKLPSWCDYPFYVVGPGTTFSSPAPEHADLRIWGLNAFDPSQAIYFYHAWNGDVVAVKPRCG
ncbi:MAG: hypothetical protein ACLRP3_05620 [Escherichia sp.]